MISHTANENARLIKKLRWFIRPRQLSNEVFDRNLKKRHRHFLYHSLPGDYYDYLRKESCQRLIDRLEDVTRTFPTALELGAYKGDMIKLLSGMDSLKSNRGGIGGIEHLTQCDIFDEVDVKADMLYNDRINTTRVSVDEEKDLPFPDKSFDLVISSMNMHWINNLPGALSSVHRLLKPDGAFIASMLGMTEA